MNYSPNLAGDSCGDAWIAVAHGVVLATELIAGEGAARHGGGGATADHIEGGSYRRCPNGADLQRSSQVNGAAFTGHGRPTQRAGGCCRGAEPSFVGSGAVEVERGVVQGEGALVVQGALVVEIGGFLAAPGGLELLVRVDGEGSTVADGLVGLSFGEGIDGDRAGIREGGVARDGDRRRSDRRPFSA